MQAGRQGKLLEGEAYLREVRDQLLHYRLGNLAMWTLQITELHDVDRWILTAAAGPKRAFQIGARRRKRIRAEWNHLSGYSGLGARGQIQMHRLLLVH